MLQKGNPQLPQPTGTRTWSDNAALTRGILMWFLWIRIIPPSKQSLRTHSFSTDNPQAKQIFHLCSHFGVRITYLSVATTAHATTKFGPKLRGQSQKEPFGTLYAN